MADRLFASHNFYDVRRRLEIAMVEEINGRDANYLLKVSTEDYLQYLLEKYLPTIPVLLEDQITTDQEDTWLTYQGGGRMMATNFIYDVPFEGNGEVFSFSPDRIDNYYVIQGQVIKNILRLTYTHQPSDHPERIIRMVRDDFQRDIKSITSWLNSLNKENEPFKQTLASTARTQIEYRKNKFLKDANIAASLGYPLRTKDNAPQTYTVPQQRRQIPTPPSVGREPFAPEPELDMKEYEHILSIIQNMVRVMEQSPQAFRTLNEEELRVHFLVQLNAQYAGKATGETFNFDGKTDILLRENGRNIFIAECKLWKGAAKLSEAIDQLLGYATWRDTKLAILIFNRNKDFSSVIEQIKPVLEVHPNFKRHLKYDHVSAFRCVIHHRDDKNREMTLTVMAFDVPS